MIVGSGKQLSNDVRYSVSPKPKLPNQDFLKTFQVNTAPPSSVLLDFKKKLNDRIRPLSQRDILASEAAPRDNPSIETEEDPLEFFVRSLEKLAVCTNEVLETVPSLANPSSLLDLAERLKKMYGFLFDEAKTLPPHLNTKRKMIEDRCSLQHTKLQEFQRSFVSSQAEAQILQDKLLLDLRALDDRLETILKNDDPGKEFVNLHREYRLLQKQIDSLPDTLVKQSMQSQCKEQCKMLHRESELCLQIQREVAVLDAQMLRVMKASPP
ncbi:MAG: hypothetical protein K2Y01_04675 [Rhabdochlamydiaceae bacterium]|nr:hypothetical protein [Rhabdochlamydiaceae bacterium]